MIAWALVLPFIENLVQHFLRVLMIGIKCNCFPIAHFSVPQVADSQVRLSKTIPDVWRHSRPGLDSHRCMGGLVDLQLQSLELQLSEPVETT